MTWPIKNQLTYHGVAVRVHEAHSDPSVCARDTTAERRGDSEVSLGSSVDPRDEDVRNEGRLALALLSQHA